MPKRDYFLETYTPIEKPDKVILKRTKSINGLLWFVGILTLIFSFVIFLSASFKVAGIFISIDAVVIAILWVNNQHLIYRELEIDFKNKQLRKNPIFSFLEPKTRRLEKIDGLDLSVKAVGGYASPFEEGNTDYRKTIYLVGDKEIRLFDYLSRKESLEESAKEVIRKIQNGLLPTAQKVNA